MAIQASLTQLLLRLIRDARKASAVLPKPFGLAATEQDTQALDRMARSSVPRATALLGRTAEGWEVETKGRKALLEEGRYLARLLTEPAIAFIATAIHLFAMLWLGWNPVIGAQQAIYAVTDRSAVDEYAQLGHLISVALQTGYFLFAGAAFTLAMRWCQRRPLWDRVFVGRTLVIGDDACVKNLLAQYVSKLFSQAYEFAGFAAIYAAETGSGDLLHTYGHRITRGLLLFIGLPDGRWPGRERAEAAVNMTCSQARSVKNMGAGATVIGLGHNPVSANRVDRYLLMGLTEHNGTPNPGEESVTWSELACDLQASRFAALERLIASYVVFHAAAARTRDFVNRLVPIANFLWTPVFCMVRLVTAGRIRPRFGYWDLSRTQSGTLITTTAAPVPAISIAPQDYLTLSERFGEPPRHIHKPRSAVSMSTLSAGLAQTNQLRDPVPQPYRR